MALSTSSSGTHEASSHALALPYRVNRDTLEIGDCMAVANNSEPGNSEVSVVDHEDIGLGCRLCGFDESEVVEPPELGERRLVDGEHGLEIRFVYSYDEMSRCWYRFVEAETHEGEVDVINETGVLPWLSRGLR